MAQQGDIDNDGNQAREDPMAEAQQDQLVDMLLRRGAALEQGLVVMTGFLGNAPDRGRWRLYLALDLSEYVEFRGEDVLHYQSLRTEINPLGGTIVWLRKDATVDRVTRAEGSDGDGIRHSTISRVNIRLDALQQQATFMQGDLMQGYMDAGAILRPIRPLPTIRGDCFVQPKDTCGELCTCGDRCTQGAGCGSWVQPCTG